MKEKPTMRLISISSIRTTEHDTRWLSKLLQATRNTAAGCKTNLPHIGLMLSKENFVMAVVLSIPVTSCIPEPKPNIRWFYDVLIRELTDGLGFQVPVIVRPNADLKVLEQPTRPLIITTNRHRDSNT